MAETKRERKIERGHRGPGYGGGLIEKPKDMKGTIKKLFKYMNAYVVGLVIVVICAAGSTAFNIIGPKKTGEITTIVYEGLMSKIKGGPGIDFDRIKSIIFILICLYVISAILSFVAGQIIAYISQKTTYKMRKDISKKIGRLPMKFFDGKTHGEVLSVIINDVDSLGISLNQSVMQLINSVVSIVGILIMMLTISVPMTLIALIILPVSGAFIGIVVKSSQKYFKAQQDYLGHVNGTVEETFGGQNIVKAFNREGVTLEEFEEHNRKLYECAWKSQFLSGLMMPVMMFIGNLGYVALCVVGGLLVIAGKITVGSIQSFIAYIRNFTQPISQLAQVSNMLQSAVAAGERIFGFLEEEEEESSAPDAITDVSKIRGDVEFKNVTFGYDPAKPVITNFNCKVKAGEHIAIVGNTGAGKTTIVKLLMRFYDIQQGEILLDGVNIRKYDRSVLRSVFGMVLQETWLFKGSITDNIRYGRLDASDEEVFNAAKQAHAHKFVSALKHGGQEPSTAEWKGKLSAGYSVELNEDAGNVSQGQKQLLTIARAILADNTIQILDEATSSVDTRTEQRIQRAMYHLTNERTSFIIAHRLSTIKDADRILVMKNGDVVEQGNHEQLMNKNGVYADLYKSQFESAA